MPPEAHRARLRKPTARREGPPMVIDFDDNRLLTPLFGEHDRNLARIEQELDVLLTPRGNRMAITGPQAAREAARAVLDELYRRLKSGGDINAGDVDGVIRMAGGGHYRGPHHHAKRDRSREDSVDLGDGTSVRTRKRVITARSPAQAAYLAALQSHDLVFGLGPAGTGKTYLAVAVAVSMLLSGKVDRIVLSRPAVEAGERLGFLPGDMREKIDPYLRPLYDALYDMLPAEQVVKRLETGEIEIAPLAFMRGRTLANAFVILDEAQNTTPVQMKMLLTRLGEHSRMCVNGDLTQVDLPPGVASGLQDALAILADETSIATVHFTDADVVRHSLVARIIRAYARRGASGKP
ncbi:MAG TPA: PhoH family protein [Candidatus Cybelea sp.]|nr:PhoH family protein [Candidatus Cybelea sp.]